MWTHTILSLLLLISFQVSGQSTNTERKLSNVNLKQIQGSDLINYKFLEHSKGKITIIDFWETYCGPCIKAMHHLDALKKKYPNDLKIICVSNENLVKTIDFINNKKYPFDFLFDKEKQLTEIFPHLAIPHTILIGKDGRIKNKTRSGPITTEKIDKLINGEVSHKNSIAPTASNNFPTKKQSSLFTFELFRHKPAESKSIIHTKGEKKSLQIASDDSLIDTVEIINSCNITGYNIIDLYQYGFGGTPTTRFIPKGKLNYIYSTEPIHLYNLNFSCSNLFGDFKSVFIQQLNGAFGLSTKVVEKECTYYELVEIKEKLNKVEPIENSSIKIKNTILSGYMFELSNIFPTSDIANILAKQIIQIQQQKYYNEKGKRLFFPVTTNLKGNYALQISIEDDSLDVDKWIELLANNGLILVKKKGMLSFIEIEKATNR